MKTDEILEIYEIILKNSEDIISKNNLVNFRKSTLESITYGFKKIAFDTRRIDQETEYNPRRGLQNYHRSEQFISEAMHEKINNFSKLRNIVKSIESQYGRNPEWQDSYARVLLSSLDKGLRSKQKDGDYTDSQPAMGGFEYLEQLLDLRYRLSQESLNKFSEEQISKIILNKDEDLVRAGINQLKTNGDIKEEPQQITRHDVATQNYDLLVEKLFGGIKATKENKNVERIVTISIKDRLNEEDTNKSDNSDE